MRIDVSTCTLNYFSELSEVKEHDTEVTSQARQAQDDVSDFAYY